MWKTSRRKRLLNYFVIYKLDLSETYGYRHTSMGQKGILIIVCNDLTRMLSMLGINVGSDKPSKLSETDASLHSHVKYVRY